MKRIYAGNEKSPQRRALEQETLLHLRALRAQMKKQNPGVLENIRALYEKSQKLAAAGPSVVTGAVSDAGAPSAGLEDKTAHLPPDAEIPIDREKNMRTVAAFLKLRGLSLEELKRPH